LDVEFTAVKCAQRAVGKSCRALKKTSIASREEGTIAVKGYIRIACDVTGSRCKELCCIAAHGQAVKAALPGDITDVSGAVVPEAKVSITR
jgi:hypothetical protein